MPKLLKLLTFQDAECRNSRKERGAKNNYCHNLSQIFSFREYADGLKRGDLYPFLRIHTRREKGAHYLQ
jgi:hypothetical protein